MTMRSATLGPTPGVRLIDALSPIAMAEASSPGLNVPSTDERHLGADALHGLQQAEPFALGVAEKAEQADLVFAHVRLDRQRRRLAGAGSACSVRAEQCTR